MSWPRWILAVAVGALALAEASPSASAAPETTRETLVVPSRVYSDCPDGQVVIKDLRVDRVVKVWTDEAGVETQESRHTSFTGTLVGPTGVAIAYEGHFNRSDRPPDRAGRHLRAVPSGSSPRWRAGGRCGERLPEHPHQRRRHRGPQHHGDVQHPGLRGPRALNPSDEVRCSSCGGRPRVRQDDFSLDLCDKSTAADMRVTSHRSDVTQVSPLATAGRLRWVARPLQARHSG